MQPGIDCQIPYEQKTIACQKIQDFYAIKPDAPIYQREFGFYGMHNWIAQGYVTPKDKFTGEDYGKYHRDLFMFDEKAINVLHGLGWCEAGFFPKFEEKVLEDLGEYELVQDWAGRAVLCFKGRRSGFMPEYKDHPVKDMETWERDVKWRLNPDSEGRHEENRQELETAIEGAKRGEFTRQEVAGGYMYLRSLMGPEELLYNFYDCPELIEDCMETWFKLADSVIAYNQQFVTIDELALAEDICYNCGSLISPDMMKEYLLPYYKQLFINLKKRNLDKTRDVHFMVDTDGFCVPVIELYQSVGCDFMSPFEVASHCDVVKIGADYPDLRMYGGVDKRVLATDFDSIDRHIDYIMTAMRKRGGYIPTCDHGVPEEVSFENYIHYRQKVVEYCK